MPRKRTPKPEPVEYPRLVETRYEEPDDWATEEEEQAPEEKPPAPAPKKKPRRRRKSPARATPAHTVETAEDDADTQIVTFAQPPEEQPPKEKPTPKKRSRRRKSAAATTPAHTAEPAEDEADAQVTFDAEGRPELPDQQALELAEEPAPLTDAPDDETSADAEASEDDADVEDEAEENDDGESDTEDDDGQPDPKPKVIHDGAAEAFPELVQLGTWDENYPVTQEFSEALPDAAIANVARELADAMFELDELVAENKATKAMLKAREEDAHKRVLRLRKQVKDGKRIYRAPVLVMADPKQALAVRVRLDTMERVPDSERTLTTDELEEARQIEIPGV